MLKVQPDTDITEKTLDIHSEETEATSEVETDEEVNTPSQRILYTPDLCPVCKEKMNRFELGNYEDLYDLYSCVSCGSVFLDPPITQSDIDNFYSEVDVDITHIANYQKTITKLEKIFKKYIPNISNKDFLSVGTSQGYDVAAAKNLGFKSVKGVSRYEFYTEFAQKNYGEEYFECVSPEKYAEEGNTADVVVAIENFCQLANIEDRMKAISKMVRPGGILYIEEVDGNSHFLPGDLTRWSYFVPPLTVNFVSQNGMIDMLEKNGFTVKKKLWNWGYMMKIIAVKNK